MKNAIRLSAIALVLFAGLASKAFADGDWEAHPNHVAIFGGVTTPESESSQLTLGADYERRFCEMMGAGVIADFALGENHDKRHQIYAAAFYLHPMGDLKFILATGGERLEPVGGKSAKWKVLGRVGASYDFHVAGMSVSPTASLDMTPGGHIAAVYGVSVGYGF